MRGASFGGAVGEGTGDGVVGCVVVVGAVAVGVTVGGVGVTVGRVGCVGEHSGQVCGEAQVHRR